MKFTVKHEGTGRIRIHLLHGAMSFREADIFQIYMEGQPYISKVRVFENTRDAAIYYDEGCKETVINCICGFSYENAGVPEKLLTNSGRELDSTYREKIITTTARHYLKKLLPYQIRFVLTCFQAAKFILKGLRCLTRGKIEVAVLDATAIGVSVIRSDIKTAGSIMFLLKISEILEEWTHRKSVGDLARSMSLQTSSVWLIRDGAEMLVSSGQVQIGDLVCVHMGNVIPFDGVVEEGEGMINQASMTGEAIAVRKAEGSYVYAGTVLEEGEIRIRVKETAGSSRYEKIVTMIEKTEKLKSVLENKAENLADRLVPWSLGGTALTYVLTRDTTKALSILMVDFSCALQLTAPVSVLSAIREAGERNMTVKGGKYLEAVAEADTIVFDKTGTLTKADPSVVKVISFSDSMSENELLRIAACMEEHFPHSMAKAVVAAARERNLVHEEMHSKVEYIVAHGIATTIENKRTVIGSYHFVMEDEGCIIPEGKKHILEEASMEYSLLYMAIENTLAAVICIEDPLRPEAAEVVEKLRQTGIKRIVMMTGDGERAARSIASKLGLDEYYSEVLPEDKARYIEKQKQMGRKVIMVGDGINDSLALSTADVGIAISDGAEIAREVADITIAARDLNEIAVLRRLATALMKRIKGNYRSIVGFNAGLIALGVSGVIAPTTSALLHNMSTLLFTVRSMGNLLED